MKAVVYDRYGGPDELRVVDLPLPSPAAGQVRLKVAATSVNLSDWECLRGSPAYARIGGPRSRMRRTLGSDIAGVVDGVGEGVNVRVGDHVYGDSLVMKGGFAEYAVVPQAALARKPVGLTFAEASTIPQSGAIALQGSAGAMPGARVLINGAGGGSGTFAIQLAKRLGAHVTAVDNAAKQDFMASVGADEVVDFRRTDFTRQPRPTTSSWTWSPTAQCSLTGVHCRRAERIAVWGGRSRAVLRVLTVGMVAGRLTARSIGVLAVKEGPPHFEPLADLCVRGEVRIYIDQVFTLEEVPAALARVGEGRALGKVVVTLET